VFGDDFEIVESPLLPLPSPTPESMSELTPVRILLVDGERAQLELYQTLLTREGFEVATAENGTVGYEMALRDRPDVIVSEIMMPELDGWGFLNLVRRDVRLSDTRFLLHSSHGAFLEKLKELHAGANDYLCKGLSAEEFIARVADSVALQRRLQAALDLDVSFGGLVQDVGLRPLLQALGARGMSGFFAIEDRLACHQVQFSEGKIVTAKSESGHMCHIDDEALAQLLGIESGYFEFTAASPVEDEGEDVSVVLDRVGEGLNEERRRHEARMFAQDVKLECDARLADLYLGVCPESTRPLAHSIVNGVSPRTLLGSSQASPVLVERVVQDLVSKQVATFVEDAA
jgi:CheY-like chemotaxis protein